MKKENALILLFIYSVIIWKKKKTWCVEAAVLTANTKTYTNGFCPHKVPVFVMEVGAEKISPMKRYCEQERLQSARGQSKYLKN